MAYHSALGKVLVIDFNTIDKIYEVDVTTGNVSTFSTLSGYTDELSGIAYDPVGDVLYVSYIVSMPTPPQLAIKSTL